MLKNLLAFLILYILFWLGLTLSRLAYGQSAQQDVTGFGLQLPNLTATEVGQFNTGEAGFVKTQTVTDDGLGPIFNGQSCVQCHNVPTIGGSSGNTETRFGQLVNGVFNPLLNESGSLLHQNSITPAVQMVVPDDANVVARRKANPLFGLGLIEAIPDAEIIANKHNPPVDGITGVPAMVQDHSSGQNGTPNVNLVGRFGWKNQIASLLEFSADAYINEIGVTTRIPGFNQDIAPDGNQAALLAVEPSLTGFAFDQLQDEEKGGFPQQSGHTADIDGFADFMRMLSPPPVVPMSASAQNGKFLFTQINCVACHKPTAITGASNIAALAFQNIAPYSDFLLHDMGTLGDGIAQGAASTTQMRTQPLWGLRARAPFLHDGRSPTILDAILQHAGEATIVVARFKALTPAQQQSVIDFLNTI
jgi:CxxC motif-containing protein (DUF1111 family)